MPAHHAAVVKPVYSSNFVGFEGGATSGDVITRNGEFLGTSAFATDEEAESGMFHFIADGNSDPVFSSLVPLLGSGMLTGMAMSDTCSSIRDWHDDQH